eukprot:12162070-Prorocentrum_lima.AAC.1
MVLLYHGPREVVEKISRAAVIARRVAAEIRFAITTGPNKTTDPFVVRGSGAREALAELQQQ